MQEYEFEVYVNPGEALLCFSTNSRKEKNIHFTIEDKAFSIAHDFIEKK